MTLEQAKSDLLAAYQQLEHAQAQLAALQQHLRQCELRKVQCEAVVQALVEQTRGQ